MPKLLKNPLHQDIHPKFQFPISIPYQFRLLRSHISIEKHHAINKAISKVPPFSSEWVRSKK
jgi:hypothetical protein